MQSKLIREYSFPAFAFSLQEAILDGYQLSEDSSHYPSLVGWFYEATVLKQDKESAARLDFSVATKPKQNTRKANNAN